jgi:hypothetical protein
MLLVLAGNVPVVAARAEGGFVAPRKAALGAGGYNPNSNGSQAPTTSGCALPRHLPTHKPTFYWLVPFGFC